MERGLNGSFDSAALAARAKNFVASGGIAALASAIYLFSPYNAYQVNGLYGWVGFSFTGAEFLIRVTAGYIVLLFFYYLLEPQPQTSKSVICLRTAANFVRSPRALWGRPLAREDRVAVLATLLKAFFGPMMTMSLMVFLMSALVNGASIIETGARASDFRTVFDRYGYWFLIQTILFVDVAMFTVGYLVEMPRLRNEIRSVDPTLLGWSVAIACYPPFNIATGAILGFPVSDFPRFDDPTTHLSLNIALLTLMAIYAWASVALGFKASNLTHRGIVSRGPYAVIRHPAYVCKNLAWWIGSIPVVSAAFAQSFWSGIQLAASVVAWSMIYILRALTEEDHLKRVDGEYAAYAAKVRYRFVPGVV